jgi:hypothetical protein
MSRDPRTGDREPTSCSHFCYGCPTLYKTRKLGTAAKINTRNNAEFGQLYTLNRKGRPVRRTETVSWTPVSPAPMETEPENILPR